MMCFRRLTTVASLGTTRLISDRLKARMASSGPLKPLNTVLDGPNELEKLLPPEVEEAHRAACANGEELYKDPKTGLMVFTRVAHVNKGKCCGNKCRHCPYGHINVPASRRPTPTSPATGSETLRTAPILDQPGPTTAPTPATPSLRKSGVYTKTGDRGTTSLFTGERRSKTDLVFHSLGTIDELNSHVGLARAYLDKEEPFPFRDELMQGLLDIQRRLLHCGAIIATPGELAPLDHRPEEWTAALESLVDRMDSSLPPLSSFILPGGGLAAAQLHVCRSTCRRAERTVVDLLGRDEQQYRGDVPHQAAIFLNRLSDFFFVAARRATNAQSEAKWDKFSS